MMGRLARRIAANVCCASSAGLGGGDHEAGRGVEATTRGGRAAIPLRANLLLDEVPRTIGFAYADDLNYVRSKF